MDYKSSHLSQTGFTLVEILVSVTILAISMSAIIASSTGFIRDTTLLRDRYIASLVAENRIAEMKLAPQLPSLGVNTGTTQMVDNSWAWKTTTKKTFDQYGVVVLNTKVEITSAADPKQKTIFTMNAFFSEGSK